MNWKKNCGNCWNRKGKTCQYHGVPVKNVNYCDNWTQHEEEE